MANEKNLKPFKKGQSGNPKGRPTLMPELKEAIAQILGEEKEGRSALEAILSAMRAKAAKGDVKAAEFLFDRIFNKPKQEISGSINSTVTQIKVVRE